MADGDETADQLDAEAQSFIDELLEAGFKYDQKDRLQGFSGVDDEGVHAGDDEATDENDDTSEDAGETGDDGAGSSAEDGDEAEGADEADGGDSDSAGDVGSPSGRAPSPLDDLPAGEAEALLGLRTALIEHPELADEIGKRLDDIRAGRPITREAPPEPEMPDFLDPDDEAAVAFWKRQQELEARVGSIETSTEKAVVDHARAEASANVNRAAEKFAAAHPDLTPEDIANIRNHTSANVNVPGVMANFQDPIEGLVRALEIGSMSDPLSRDKVLGITKSRDAADAKRKSNLDALAGSSGSAPRRPGRRKKITGSEQEKWNTVSKQLAAELEKIGGPS